MLCSAMNITSLLYIGRMLEHPLLLLFGGLLAVVSTIGHVDFPTVLLLF
jgi:hypothetical protein